MDMFSVVLIAHDGLDAIENDPNFGKNLSDAITRKRSSPENYISVSAGNHANSAEIIGGCFHGDDIRCIVIEGGTGWVAQGQIPPHWSNVTQSLIIKKFQGVTCKS